MSIKPKRIPRVLSIQSHVVHGFVGNKCATFILQLYGFEVDVINSVHFSNHTGYDVVKGSRLSVDELRAIFQGLIANEIFEYDYILTGYMGSGELLNVVAEYVRIIKSKSPHVKYLCDPVIGDNGELYVDQSCIEMYKNVILPLADIVTPNDFEMELLIGKQIKCNHDDNKEQLIWQSLQSLHNMGPTRVIISSISAVKLGGKETMLQMYASSKNSDNQYEIFRIDFPYLEGCFTGTGDLFSALILAWFHRENNLISACEKSISILHQVLLKTLETSESINIHNTCGNELNLIESAIKKWIDLQNSGDNLIVMLADLHAVTIPREPDALRKSTLETAASLIACGIDPKRSIIYRQSDLHHHTQLSWLLGTLTTVQKVGHIPTYKSKVKDETSIPLGLFLYPILQTADILLFKTTHLPIGEDQIPHLQLCTYMIEKFYHYYKQNIFPVPQMMATETTRIRSLRHPEQKMSKSDYEERSRIDIMDDEKMIQERIMKALTDFNAQVSYNREQRPGVSNLIDIYAGITSQSIESIVNEAQQNNLNTGQFKKRLAEIIVEHFRSKRLEYLKLMNDRTYLLNILDDGRKRAKEIADKTLNEVKHIMGF
ncbi:unnamed protein product [Rotaria sordida]|uniref:Pyridoxal kinase n=1 Tax=Rotaria sordida TaxID=392033 RepID=A0A818MER7_9BILA|nr:unnamed protein product [Rotaria sordida]